MKHFYAEKVTLSRKVIKNIYIHNTSNWAYVHQFCTLAHVVFAQGRAKSCTIDFMLILIICARNYYPDSEKRFIAFQANSQRNVSKRISFRNVSKKSLCMRSVSKRFMKFFTWLRFETFVRIWKWHQPVQNVLKCL